MAASAVPEVGFRGQGLLQALFANVDLGLGGGDGVMIVASPPPPAGSLEVRLAGGERLLGFVSGPNQVRQLTAGLMPFLAAVRRDLRVELGHPTGGGGPGVSKLANAEGERAISADTRRDYPSPGVVELIVESADVLSPPPFGPLESLQDVPVSLQGGYPGSDLVSFVFGFLGLLTVNREALPQITAFGSTASAQTGESCPGCRAGWRCRRRPRPYWPTKHPPGPAV